MRPAALPVAAGAARAADPSRTSRPQVHDAPGPEADVTGTSVSFSDLSMRLYARLCNDGPELQCPVEPASAMRAQLSLASAIEALRTALRSEASIRQRTEIAAPAATGDEDKALEPASADAELAAAHARSAEFEQKLRDVVRRCEALLGTRSASMEALVGMGTPALALKALTTSEPGEGRAPA